MLLAVDVGNTNITLGAFDGDQLVAEWRMATDLSRMADEYGLMLRQFLAIKGVLPEQIGSVVMCSVVPSLQATFTEVCQRYLDREPMSVGAGTKTGIRILYDSPRDVGADRIVDAAAALKIYGGPVIVVDLGTATVFDAVTKAGEYLGGAISPGMNIAANSLVSSTSMLRRVALEPPPSAIGRNTIHCLQSGLVLGYAELVKGMVRRFDEEMGGGCKVIGTGGLARIVEKEAGVFDAVDVHLTLKGLKIIHELNAR
jgi:type III pantothenate kinase